MSQDDPVCKAETVRKALKTGFYGLSAEFREQICGFTGINGSRAESDYNARIPRKEHLKAYFFEKCVLGTGHSAR